VREVVAGEVYSQGVGFSIDGQEIGTGTFELDGLAMYDNFAHADTVNGPGTLGFYGAGGITPSPAPTMPPEYTVTADLRARGAEPIHIPPMNGWPALPVPAEAKAGDRVAWTIRDGAVVATEIHPPSEEEN
jgi:hypothetical protein